MNREKGSVLIYIFIAIVVLAALTFAVSRGGRQGSGTINKERSDLLATQILDYTEMIRRAIQTMKINGLNDEDLCFDSDRWGNNNYDHAACSETKNQIFNSGGGGAVFQDPATDVLDTALSSQSQYGQWHFTGANNVTGVGSDCDPNADCNELLLILPYIRRDVCLALNKKLQTTTPDIVPVDDANFDMTSEYTGTYIDGETINSVNLRGKRSGCFQATTTPVDGAYFFFAVLIAR